MTKANAARHRYATLSHAVAAAAVVVTVASSAEAAVPLVEGETFQLHFGGYASSFNMYSRLGYELDPAVPDQTATGAALLRAEWRAQLGEDCTLDVHNRLFYSSSSSGIDGGTGFGLGSTIAPQRSLQLESVIVDDSGIRLAHDLDRLALSYFSPVGDFTLGRQAITWGVSNIFVVSDVWTQFSPFELDTSQKRGVDALRFLSYPTEGLELDMVVVDRGGLDEGDASNLSGGIKAGMTFGSGDYYLSAAKSYDNLLALAGTNYDLETLTARLEAALPYRIDDSKLELPRATAGVDYLTETFSISGEYHFNGPGTADQDEYADALLLDPDPEVQRGERYFIGQHYAGLMSMYSPWTEVRLTGVVISNLLDPSALVAPSISYDFSASVSGTVGAYLGFGKKPSFDLGPPPTLDIPSEFGLVGQSYFVQLAGFI